jgi:hypothetical protein
MLRVAICFQEVVFGGDTQSEVIKVSFHVSWFLFCERFGGLEIG